MDDHPLYTAARRDEMLVERSRIGKANHRTRKLKVGVGIHLPPPAS